MTSLDSRSKLGLRAWRTLLTLVALVVSTVALVPAGARAADANPPRAQFSSVSCPSPSFCLAVGSRDNAEGTPVPFTETFDGKAWRIRTTSVPWSSPSSFGAVSCVDRNFCIATTSVGGTDRAARWNGTTWSLVKLGGTAPSGLSDVQCRSRTFCMLVGTVTNRGVAAAWHYNGYAWYPQTLPHPGQHVLRSISCPTSKICFAAGYLHVGYAEYAYVLRWGGAGWHASYLPRHEGGFFDISCLTITRCTAVGTGGSTTGSAASGLVVDLANGKWRYTFLSAKKIEGSPVSGMHVACSSVACTAVVDYTPRQDTVNSADLIAVRGVSGGFVLGSQRFPDLSGLSCTGTSCIVVGSTLADIRNSDTIPPKPCSATAYRRHGTTLARFAVPQH